MLIRFESVFHETSQEKNETSMLQLHLPFKLCQTYCGIVVLNFLLPDPVIFSILHISHPLDLQVPQDQKEGERVQDLQVSQGDVPLGVSTVRWPVRPHLGQMFLALDRMGGWGGAPAVVGEAWVGHRIPRKHGKQTQT